MLRSGLPETLLLSWDLGQAVMGCRSVTSMTLQLETRPPASAPGLTALLSWAKARHLSKTWGIATLEGEGSFPRRCTNSPFPSFHPRPQPLRKLGPPSDTHKSTPHGRLLSPLHLQQNGRWSSRYLLWGDIDDGGPAKVTFPF